MYKLATYSYYSVWPGLPERGMSMDISVAVWENYTSQVVSSAGCFVTDSSTTIIDHRPDNYIQDATHTQSYKRYSYALNNPLKYSDPSREFIFTALLAPIGLVPLGVIIEGACWSAAIDAGIQGIRIASGQQQQFNWSELGGAAVGGAVFAGMGLIAPSFSVT